MKKSIIVGLVMVLFCAMVHAEGSKQKAEKAAVSAAEATLKLIDDGKYVESWSEAAGFFKQSVGKDQWVAAMETVRKPLGKLVSRKVAGKKYMTQLPGAPAGEYVVIQFKTSFENKADAIETFTPMLDKEGQWRMSGYFIK